MGPKLVICFDKSKYILQKIPRDNSKALLDVANGLIMKFSPKLYCNGNRYRSDFPIIFTNKMPEILHNLVIHAPLKVVYYGFTTPKGLDCWWTKKSAGKPVAGSTYHLDFGEYYRWEAVVTKTKPNLLFELKITQADEEWMNTKIGVVLIEGAKGINVSFYHKSWRSKTDGFKFSSYCWAMYLRILKRNLERDEKVPYSKRLSV